MQKKTILAMALTLTFPIGLYASPIEVGFDNLFDESLTDLGTDPVDIDFPINFFGYGGEPDFANSLYINTNGTVTLDRTFDGFAGDLLAQDHFIIAPFFENIDSNNGSISYGTGAFEGGDAFGINWKNVSVDGLLAPSGENTFQTLLVDRYDADDLSTSKGDFDIVFNYGQIEWGDSGFFGQGARVGYSVPGGSEADGDFFQLPGSADKDGAFLEDGDYSLVNNSRNSTEKGRYIFSFRNGRPVDPESVPTPSTLALLGLGLLGLAFARRRVLNG